MASRIGLPLGLLCITGIAGCGTRSEAHSHLKDVSGVAVKVQLLQNGKPLKISKDEEIFVSFVLKSDANVVSPSEFNPAEGTFTIPGPTGKGIPLGTYRIGLSSSDYNKGGLDRFADQFATDKTPLIAEVGSEEGQFFEVDVGTKRVVKK
jgi:hypothetical protein